jgi:NAD(P)-dependent dehydrogenase (short-subunit alcohol dehydrogenase family)
MVSTLSASLGPIASQTLRFPSLKSVSLSQIASRQLSGDLTPSRTALTSWSTVRRQGFAKDAVRGLCEAIRREFRQMKSRSRVGQISPGYVDTPFIDKFYGNEANEERHSIQRMRPKVSPHWSCRCWKPHATLKFTTYLSGPPNSTANPV